MEIFSDTAGHMKLIHPFDVISRARLKAVITALLKKEIWKYISSVGTMAVVKKDLCVPCALPLFTAEVTFGDTSMGSM